MIRRSACFAAAALAVACTEAPVPTGPDPGAMPTPTAHVPAMSASAAPLPLALVPVQDALDRILDVLPERPAKVTLQEALVQLAQAIEEDASCQIRTHRRSAEFALRDLSRRQPDEYEADFEVVTLALGTVEQSGPGRC